jgi:hypothetical protein
LEFVFISHSTMNRAIIAVKVRVSDFPGASVMPAVAGCFFLDGDDFWFLFHARAGTASIGHFSGLV